MDLSLAANILGAITGIGTLSAWFWHLHKAFQAKLAEAQESAQEGKNLAQQLLSQATNPERRADIYTFITLQTIEIQAGRTRTSVHICCLGILLIGMTMFASVSIKILAIDYKHPLVILVFGLILAFLASLVMVAFYEFLIRKMENGWLQGAKTVLHTKLDKHTSKT